MSYEITLYHNESLERAIFEQPGDWSNPTPISEESLNLALRFVLARGYIKQDYPWVIDAEVYQHPRDGELLEVTLHKANIYFAVQISEDEDADFARVNEAKTTAIELGKLANLSVYDPQDARIIYQAN